jgi:D-3-phosphoglycerate dehydrogenase / 2-oxoglutarate reductase
VNGSWTVFVTAPALSEPGLRMLTDAGCEVILLSGSKDEAEVAETLATRPVDAVLSRTLTLDGAAMRSCPTLKMISKHGAGVNNVDVDAATTLGIPVTYTPGANARAVAELAIGLMLAAARRITWFDTQLKAGRWTPVPDGVELAGRTLGLVGFGNVGSKVGALGTALGMDVVAYDPVLTSASDGVRAASSLEEVLRVADVLSLHVPLTDDTRGMIGGGELDLLPDGAIVINTARGPVLDDVALVAALRGGRLRAAGIDTLAHEPIRPDDPLRALENVVLTPHVGGSTVAALRTVSAMAARNVLTMMRGEPVEERFQVDSRAFGAAAGVVR